MKKIISLIEDKIREVENDNGEIENLELSEEYIKGYKNGLKHAKTIIEENYKKERMFYDTECCEVLNEEKVRKFLDYIVLNVDTVTVNFIHGINITKHFDNGPSGNKKGWKERRKVNAN